MEGKELHNNEDEELDPKSKNEEDADDFGLPEIEDSQDKADDLADPYSESWEDKKEEEDNSYSDSSDDSSDDSSYDTESSDSEYGYSDDVDEADATEEEVESTEEEYKSSYYEEEYGQKKSPVGWIIFGVFVLIAIIVAVFWWLNRDKPEPKPAPPPVIEQPVQEPEPQVIEEEPEPIEPVKTAGVFEINEPTGRYHVIVASSIDVDLIRDYGNKLAAQGMTCNILAPRGNKKFHRLSVDDYVLLNDASIKSEQLKGTLGEDVWVIRY